MRHLVLATRIMARVLGHGVRVVLAVFRGMAPVPVPQCREHEHRYQGENFAQNLALVAKLGK